MAEKIPTVVKEFVGKYVDSIAVLEMLLFLRREEKREWGAAALSKELKLERGNVELRLEQMKKQGLLASRKSGTEHVYRYEPSSKELEDTVKQLAECYVWQPVALMGLIFGKK